MRTAYISLTLGAASLVSTLLIAVFLTLDVRIFMFFNILSPIITLSAFVLGVKGIFIKEGNKMKAGKIILNIETKVININPE